MNTGSEPIERFQQYWHQARQSTAVQQKSAVCVSSIDSEGFPQARFVDLKQADDAGFIFCTDYQSAKGAELLANPKAALTIWWEHLSVQIRITGTASRISDEQAKIFWNTRSREAQLTTLSSQQSQVLQNQEHLKQRFSELTLELDGSNIPKPEHWGGFLIQPHRIEFLQFQENRMHIRDLYLRKDNQWLRKSLQP